MSVKYKHYSLAIQWSIPHRTYIVTVPELPGCTARGATYEEAIKNVQAAIATWIDVNEKRGGSIPEPNMIKDYTDD